MFIEKLYQYFQIAKGELRDDSLDFNFLKFCETYNFSHKKTANIFQILVNNSIIEINSKYSKKSTIIFKISGNHLARQHYNNKLTKKLIDFILEKSWRCFSERDKN